MIFPKATGAHAPAGIPEGWGAGVNPGGFASAVAPPLSCMGSDPQPVSAARTVAPHVQ